MATEFWKHHSGSMRKTKKLYKHLNGSFRDVKEKWVMIGGSFRLVFSEFIADAIGFFVGAAGNRTTAARSTYYNSDPFVVDGINVPVMLSINSPLSRSFSVNGGAFSSDTREVSDGDSIRLRVISSSNFATTTAVTATLAGGDSEVFTVKTLNSSQPPDPDENGGQGCFWKETDVEMSDGSFKAAKNLVIGDELKALSSPTMIDESDPSWREWAVNDLNGSFTTSTITGLLAYTADYYHEINETVMVTGTDTFLVYSDETWQWKYVSDVAVGDGLFGSDGNVHIVYSNDRIDEPLEVVRISVEETDNYFAGDINGVTFVAHNK